MRIPNLIPDWLTSDTGESSEDTATFDDKRRRVLQGVTATAVAGAVPGMASASTSESSFSDADVQGSAYSKVFDTSEREEVKLTEKQQKQIGEFITDTASDLLKTLKSEKMLAGASIDVTDLKSGEAFESTGFDGDAAESGAISLLKSRGETAHTQIEYGIRRSAERGDIDEETRLSIVVIPEKERAYAVVSPTETPEAGAREAPFQHIEPNPNIATEETNTTSSEGGIPEPSPDGTVFTYCWEQFVGNCVIQKVTCQGGSCSSTTEGTCICNDNSPEYAKCEQLNIGDCWYYRNPCPDGTVTVTRKC